MKPVAPSEFERNCADASGAPDVYRNGMIRTVMDKSDWLILITLALIWGGAFVFIGVAVRHVDPLTYVWLRLTIAAAAMWAFLKLKGQPLGLPREVWGSILLLALLNNALPFTLFGWGQTHIASGLAAILNATTPIWGVIVAHILTKDERMNPRKIGGVLLGFGGVAVMIGPTLLANIGTDAACPARLHHRLALLRARRRLGAPVPAHGPVADVGDHRPADRRRGDDAADDAAVRAALDAAFPSPDGLGRDRRARPVLHRVRLRALFPADRFGGRDQRPAGHLAGAAGRHLARRAVPQRIAGPAGLRRPRP